MTTPPLLTRLWPALAAALMALRAALAPLMTLRRRERGEVCAALRAMEALARKAVLIEARELAPKLAQAKPRPPRAAALVARASRPRLPRVRLWPKLRLHARVRVLGPPTSVREIWRARQRAALIARLEAGRGKRKPAYLRLADRLDALERLIGAHAAAARRLARKLVIAPALASAIAAAPQAHAAHIEPDLVHEVCHVSLRAAFDTS